MAQITTTKHVNLYQLGQEIGGSPSFRMVDDGRERTIHADIDQEALDSAVEAHQADPSIIAPPSPAAIKEAERYVTMTAVDLAIIEAIDDLKALAAAPALPEVPSGTLTTAQLSNALRALRDEAQATRAGAQKVATTLANTIRLVRGDFDDPVVATRQ